MSALFDPLYAARDALFAYFDELITNPMVSFVTHPVPTFMWLALAGLLVISRNGPAR